MPFDLRTMLVAMLRDPDVASALREAIGIAPPDELLDRAKVEAEFPFKWRVVTDAAKRGDEGLTIEYAGRKPLVRRSVLEAWITSRASKPIAKCANDSTADERSEARAAIARAAAREGSR